MSKFKIYITNISISVNDFVNLRFKSKIIYIFNQLKLA